MKKRVVMMALLLLTVSSGSHVIADEIETTEKVDSAYLHQLAIIHTLRAHFWEKYEASQTHVDNEGEKDKAGAKAYTEGWVQAGKDAMDPNDPNSAWSLAYTEGYNAAQSEAGNQYYAGFGTAEGWANEASKAIHNGEADGYSVGYLTASTGIVRPLPDDLDGRNLTYTGGELTFTGFTGFILYIFDLLGRSHVSYTVSADAWSIRPELSAGVHIIRLYTSGEAVTYKLLVK